MIVRIKRPQLSYFRRKARANSDKEIYGVLIGRKLNGTAIEVLRIEYPKLSRQSKYVVQPEDEAMNLIGDFAQACKLLVLGSIHSHLNSSTELSVDDFVTFKTGEELIQAVCNVSDKRTWITFWQPHSSLPCRIEYFEE